MNYTDYDNLEPERITVIMEEVIANGTFLTFGIYDEQVVIVYGKRSKKLLKRYLDLLLETLK